MVAEEILFIWHLNDMSKGAKILLLILITSITFAQESVIYGLWASGDSEFVDIDYDNTFTRFKKRSATKYIDILAMGSVEIVNNEMRIIRKDTIDSYNLCYYVGNETMVVCRPRSEKAWRTRHSCMYCS